MCLSLKEKLLNTALKIVYTGKWKVDFILGYTKYNQARLGSGQRASIFVGSHWKGPADDSESGGEECRWCIYLDAQNLSRHDGETPRWGEL